MPEGNEPESNEQWVDLVPVKAVAKIDLAARLREAEHAAKHGQKPPAPAEPAAPKSAAPASKVPWAMIATVVLLAVGGLGAGWFLTQSKEEPRQASKPVATPSRKPTPTPSPRFTPRPTPVPAPPTSPTAVTYTVQPGDTLITIGEKLNKDWQTIAAANGFITDPNLIHPGQVLRIP